jgi:hypothetical protein
MRVIPETDLAAIEFCETHLSVWAADPARVGLTAERCEQLLEQTRAARAAYAAAEQVRQAALAATATLHDRADSMRATAAAMVKAVKAFASASDDPPGVFVAAQIPQPARPSPRPAPPPPSKIGTRLNGDGSVTLSWTARGCAPSTGCVFVVSRRLAGEDAFTPVGVGVSLRGGKFECVDAGLAAGTTSASYLIQGRRGAGRDVVSGPTGPAVTVRLGVGPVRGGQAARGAGLVRAAA